MIDTQVVIVAPHADSVGESLLTFSYGRKAQLTARMMKAQEAVSGSLSWNAGILLSRKTSPSGRCLVLLSHRKTV